MEGIRDVVLDGFCNPLELLHFAIKGKPLYLKLYRRRWKSSCSDQHYSNRYDFHLKGVKATHEFASFLKGEDGFSSDECVGFRLHSSPFPSVDMALVSRPFKRFQRIGSQRGSLSP